MVGERASNGPKRPSGLGLHDRPIVRKRKETKSENCTGLLYHPDFQKEIKL
jgi:hypothetical protein